MRFLYDDNLAPLTSEVGFLCGTPQILADAYASWQAELGHGPRSEAVRGELSSVLDCLTPLASGEETRALFVPTQSEWTAYFDNGHRGSEASARIGYLHKRVGCKGIRMCCVPHTLRGQGEQAKGRFGATILEVYSPQAEHPLGYERVVYVMDDGGRWEFGQCGRPYDFEDLEQYKARRIRDRFTPEMLDRYLRRFGLRAFDESFYVATEKSPAILVEKWERPPRYVKEYSLEEARADF